MLMTPRSGSGQPHRSLHSKLPEDDKISQEEAKKITKALDYLLLAITQAAAYLNPNSITNTQISSTIQSW
jgi:hypothetical protein